MKLKATGRMLALAMVLSVFALPALASTSVGPDAGLFQGIAQVGKTGTCDTNGEGTISGGGIGLPVLNGDKDARYRIDSPPDSVFSLSYGFGALRLCGELDSPLGTPLGASCAATRGHGGQGRGAFPNFDSPVQEIWLQNLGWDVTAGGTFAVTADVGGTSGKTGEKLYAVVQALSEGAVLGCLSKATTGDAGKGSMTPDPFTVVAAYGII
jgi:hypothetical protein